MNTLLTALLKPLALAVNCLFVPAESMRRSVKRDDAVAGAGADVSSVVVPSSGPVPAVSVTVTLLVGAEADGGIVAELVAAADDRLGRERETDSCRWPAEW